MDSRQRVELSVNHIEPDRMPIDLGMYSATGISAFAYYDLRKYLGLDTDNVEIIDMVQFTARVDEDIIDKFHIDCVPLRPRWLNTVGWSPKEGYTFKVPAHLLPQKASDGSWVVKFEGNSMKMPQNGYFFDGAWLDVPDRDKDSWFLDTAKEAERIFKETPYYTCYRRFSAFFREADIDWQCRLLTEPEEIKKEQEKSLQSALEHAGKVIDKMAGFVNAICLGADLGSQRGPLIRPSVYDELCAPYLKKLCDFIHKNSDFKIFMHCCGSIKEFIPTIIDCGVDILNPVQITADNMDPKVLKKEFGDRITFWGGGCDTQEVLGSKTPSEVRENVKTLTSIFKPSGGFVFNQIHNIMGNAPPENIVEMLEAAYENSSY